MLNKIFKYPSLIIGLPKSLYINLKYLPFKQAIKLPIILCKGNIKGRGKLNIEAPVRFGMIKLGFNTIPILPNDGCKVLLDGKLNFKGNCSIGNNSILSIGKTGELIFGDGASASAGLKIVCHNLIEISNKVLFGWNCILMDTDLHLLKYVNGGGYSQGYGTISIGENTWIANSTKICKNVSIPANCVIASDSIVCSKVECSEYTLLGNDHKLRILKQGVYHDRQDDIIKYEKS